MKYFQGPGQRRYRFAFLRVDPYYPDWDWAFIALQALIVVVAGLVIGVAVTVP